ncbi:hypothetical protein [Rudanella lutea]|uniref:hypothetical protein n=1 Tax=Rudanella lutea TaxID=451374 RepID=UPI0003713980|nr:hypothetical protein [Rudanella lutea]
MQRRNIPARRSESILLYGFGLALALSLAFNGFLLIKQSHTRSIYEYEMRNTTAHAGDDTDGQVRLRTVDTPLTNRMDSTTDITESPPPNGRNPVQNPSAK